MSEQDSEKQTSDAAAFHQADAQQAHVNRLQRLKSSGDSSLIGVKFHKVCCVCGEVLNHKPRFKDQQGRYWCPTCNEADQQKVGLALCADCAMEMSKLDLREIGGLLLCPVCFEKCMKEGKGVVEVRLRALAHGQQHARAPSIVGPKRPPKPQSNALLYALLAAVVLATLVAVIWTVMR